MIPVVNVEGNYDAILERGDRVAVLAQAAVQTRTCTCCSLIDTDAFYHDPEECITYVG